MTKRRISLSDVAGGVALGVVVGTIGQKLMIPHNRAAAITTNKTATVMIPGRDRLIPRAVRDVSHDQLPQRLVSCV